MTKKAVLVFLVLFTVASNALAQMPVARAIVETRVYRTDLGRDQGLAYYFSAGGIPIVLENQLIGVIGVGGGNGEEPCAIAAYKKVFGVDPPNAIGDRVTPK